MFCIVFGWITFNVTALGDNKWLVPEIKEEKNNKFSKEKNAMKNKSEPDNNNVEIYFSRNCVNSSTVHHRNR